MAAVEHEIKAIRERLVGAVEKRQKEIKDEIKKLRADIAKTQASEKLNERKIELAETNIADLETEREAATTKLEANRLLRDNCVGSPCSPATMCCRRPRATI